jgi:hypothetical protein
VKLLIIAGPYEADRIRRAVVSAGFEAVAVEPGESLSGWITASRPDLIVIAPQIVNPDPAVALAKVRAVPRGRVPTFLVGDAEDEPRMRDLADGFLTRPLSTDDLVTRVRARLGKGPSSPTTGERRASTGEHGIPSAMTDGGSGEFGRPGASKSGQSPAAPGSGPKGQGAAAPGSGGGRALPTLKPLVSAAESAGPTPRARPSDAGLLLGKLADGIDAALDAEMFDVARSVGALRAPPPPPSISSGPRTGANRRPPEDLFERTPMAPMTALAAAAALQPGPAETTALTAPSVFDALDDLQDYDETRQKTLEVPRDVFAKMIADRIMAARDSGTAAGAPAPVESGKIADGDVAAQLGRLYLQRLTGRLVLRRDAIEKVIFFDRGAPILGTSSDPQDRMGEMLVRQGRLTQAQLERASEGLPRAERRLGVVLVEMGFIKPTELAVVVRRHFEEIIHSAFAWEDGEWSLGPGKPDQEIVLLDEHPAAIILAGIRRKYGVARLTRCLGGGKQVFRRVTATEGGADLLAHLAMTPEERAVADLFDGVRSLDEVRAQAHVREEVVSGIAWALSVLGQLDRVDARAAVVSEAAAGIGKTNGTSAHAHEADRRREIDAARARVLQRHAVVEDGDYFDVLSLPRGASLEDVRRAHAALMSELEPTSLEPAVVTELGAQLRAIRVVLDEALRVLGEPRMRERYESHLPPAAEHAAG